MDNDNREEVLRWALKQTAYLDPPAGWQPDSATALIRFHRRIARISHELLAKGRPSWHN